MNFNYRWGGGEWGWWWWWLTRSPTRENVTGRKCILRPPSRVISGLRIILFCSTWTCIKWNKSMNSQKQKKINEGHDIWPQLVWWEKTLLVPDARNGTRCRPSSRVGQGAPGDRHDDHDALGVSDCGDDWWWRHFWYRWWLKRGQYQPKMKMMQNFETQCEILLQIIKIKM